MEKWIRLLVDEEGVVFYPDKQGLRLVERIHRGSSGNGKRQVSAAR
jgi:hypothetical protein